MGDPDKCIVADSVRRIRSNAQKESIKRKPLNRITSNTQKVSIM